MNHTCELCWDPRDDDARVLLDPSVRRVVVRRLKRRTITSGRSRYTPDPIRRAYVPGATIAWRRDLVRRLLSACSRTSELCSVAVTLRVFHAASRYPDVGALGADQDTLPA